MKQTRPARRSVAVGWRATFVVREYQSPHPRRSYWRCIRFEDAPDNGAIAEHVEIVITPNARMSGWPTLV
jgi:hypothetical protein